MNKRILSNSLWMIMEKIISIFGVIFVTSYVAKYIGPYLFGVLSISIAIFQIIQVCAQLGTDNIIFKRISRNVSSGISLILSSFGIRTVIYASLSLPVFCYWLWAHNGIEIYFFCSIFIAYYFSSLDVFSIYYDAQLKSRLNTLFNSVGLIVSLLIRYVIAYKKLDPIWLAVPIVLTAFIPFCFRMFYFFINEIKIKKIKYRKDKVYSKYILVTGISIVMSNLSVAIYTRVNQFTLSNICTPTEVGVYSAALTIATSWSFINTALISSYFTSIFSERNEQLIVKKACLLNRYVFLMGMVPVTFIYFFGSEVMSILYGADFSVNNKVLIILSISTLLSSLGIVSSRYIINKSGYSYLSIKMTFMMIISIPISYFAVFKNGIIGAAISVLIIEILSLTIANYFFKNGYVLKLHIRTFCISRKGGR